MSKLKSWVHVPDDSDFSIHNIPFGIFSTKKKTPRVGVAIGEQILDLAGVARLGMFDKFKIDKKVFYADTLNDFISLGKSKTNKVREQIQKWLSNPRSALKKHSNLLIKQSNAQMHLPITIGDYTDFYSSIEHATNVGKLFRDPANALLPNWRHLPVGYHGRASSVIVSGVDIHRPKGQTKPVDGDPVYGPCRLLDFELEMAFVIGKNSTLGERVAVEKAEDFIFGMMLFNDWSARDIQKWEYVPLGPFLGKSFASSVSPWVVTMEALEPFRVQGPKQEPKVLPYLRSKGKNNYNINLSVSIQPKGGEETVICNSNYKYMYWNQKQQLAHHTVNGCNVKVGDMMASGTISGKDETSYGSLLEMTYAGKKTLTLKGGVERKFIQDHDRVTIKGHGKKGDVRVGFGEVTAKILPAK